MKKVLATVLSAMLLVSSLAACTKAPAPVSSKPAASTPAASTPAPSSTPAPEVVKPDTSEFVELTWYLCGNSVTDDKAVLEKANAILKEKLNCAIKPIWGSWGDFEAGGAVANAISGGDNVDLYFTSSWTVDEYNTAARQGSFIRLDNADNNLIASCAPELWSKLPEVLQRGVTIMGAEGKGVYAIPNYKDYATQLAWDINGTLLKEIGFTADDVKGLNFYSDNFGKMLKAAKDAKGKDFYPLLIEPAVLERLATNTTIVTGDVAPNLLSYYLDTTDPSKDIGSKIVNKFATPEFEKFAKKIREYYLAGYVDPAMSNPKQATDKRTETLKNAKYLFSTQSYALGCEAEYSAQRKIEVLMEPTTPAYVDTTASQGALYSVSVQSKNPERAVMFLNELNTNPELYNLITYGIEGVHYKKNADNTVTLDAEARKSYTVWTNGVGSVAMPGLLMPLEAQGPDFYESFRAYYAAAKPVPNLGYAFVNANVLNEGTACGTAANQYMLPICSGSVDPTTEIPKLLKALEDNGMQKYLDEANKQLTEFFAAS